MVNLLNRNATVMPPVAASPPTPADLPPVGDPRRWSLLQRLRRQATLDPRPWLLALEAAELELQADLVAILAAHLDGEGACRLLECWLRQEHGDATLPPLLGHRRDPVWAERLRQRLPQVDHARRLLLLPLLGAQRDPDDFPLLRSLLLDPGPLPLRLAALEALSLGLSAWPLGPLRRALATVARDLQPALACAAVDLLARLPAARADLLRLERQSLDPSLRSRLQRRLRALPASPLLLLVHGRSGGRIPAELIALAEELEQRRGAPVRLLALTDPQPARLPPADPRAAAATLVPLLLLPGSHVRHDLPALAAALRRQGPLRCLPFLGSWPAWQQALARELAEVSGAPATAPPEAALAEAGPPRLPLLLHHPLQGALAERYLSLLAQRTGAICQPAAFDAAGPGAAPPPGARFLPLALAANRLTDSLQTATGLEAARPLLARQRLRQLLLETLTALA